MDSNKKELAELSGLAFKNLKPFNDKSPHYFGSFLINGVAHRINIWSKKDKNNNTFFSYSIRKEETKPAE